MKEIRKTTQFKKDFKRYSKDLERVKALFEIVRKLANDEPIPAEFKPHPFGRDYHDHMECHRENSYLLIFYDKSDHVIVLFRLGCHSELFGKKRKR